MPAQAAHVQLRAQACHLDELNISTVVFFCHFQICLVHNKEATQCRECDIGPNSYIKLDNIFVSIYQMMQKFWEYINRINIPSYTERRIETHENVPTN